MGDQPTPGDALPDRPADPPDQPPPAPPETPPANQGLFLRRLDAWMEEHPWHPRVAPFVVYVGFLALIDSARASAPNSYPFLYALQCGLTLWLLLRYRRLLPELTLSFHWLAVPVGLGVAAVWVALGYGMIALSPKWFDSPQPKYFHDMPDALRHGSLVLRLVGMAAIVPMFEELFVRSLLLRSFNHWRRTGIGVLQVLQDLPVIGEWVLRTPVSARTVNHPPIFGNEFRRVALGQLSPFGVFASTAIFAAHHIPRDWPGCVFCGVAYCLVLAATRARGLGPVIWAHGITNAALWVHALMTDDFRFLG
ncbi:MAG: CPBP family glutamic-type intramembrane protease [Planctomycetota bacterium]|nr:CPBP family glutamic-type intramembrane protease [Planctomycetota bacterium]